jgi:hypothetical protein
MTDVIRIKRRSADGKPGPPETLAPSEIAYNEADGTLYYGKGDDGDGRATEIVAIGGIAVLVEIATLKTKIEELEQRVVRLEGTEVWR